MARRTVDRIVAYIRENHLKEGDFLPSGTVFYRDLGVSRVVFREAMSYLKGLGVIEAGRGSKFKIAAIGPLTIYENALPIYFAVSKDTRELSELRTRLELGALFDAFNNLDRETATRLKRIVADMETLITTPNFTVAEYERLDASFHTVIAELSGNRLLELLSRLYFEEYLKAPRHQRVDAEYLRVTTESTEEHRALVSAFAARNFEAALMIAFRHLGKKTLVPR